MAAEKEREAILKLGQFPKQWKEKVDKMSDSRVIAIYLDAKAKGKL